MKTSEQQKHVRKFRLTKKEKKYIADHHNELPAEQIALDLEKPIEAIRKWILNNIIGTIQPPEDEEDQLDSIKLTLTRKPEWHQIKKQFTLSELDTFKHKYAMFVMQFKDDIFATEESQI